MFLYGKRNAATPSDDTPHSIGCKAIARKGIAEDCRDS
jgi:hypothetical protein